MKGRKPTPQAALQLRGSRRYDPTRADANLGIPGDLPSPPDHLTDTALAEWHRLATALHIAGLLSPLDRGALATLCQCYGRMVDADAALNETGLIIKSPSGFPTPSPYLSISERAADQYRKLCTEFGLTPSSRSRAATGRTAAPDVNTLPSLKLAT